MLLMWIHKSVTLSLMDSELWEMNNASGNLDALQVWFKLWKNFWPLKSIFLIEMFGASRIGFWTPDIDLMISKINCWTPTIDCWTPNMACETHKINFEVQKSCFEIPILEGDPKIDLGIQKNDCRVQNQFITTCPCL